ncbi:MAG: ribbon-helix-helix domain-containing protein [Opitutaceae bacterium]|jgi:hypothetical protein|nr:ribbon-helix-helix domain-containing protein [Opitutaceae bacterium]
MMAKIKQKLTFHLGLRLDEDTRDELVSLAGAYGISASDLGRHAIFSALHEWRKKGIQLSPSRKPRARKEAA